MSRHLYLRLTIDVDTDNPKELVQAAKDALSFYESNGVPEGVDRCNVRNQGHTVGTLSIHNWNKD